MPLDDTLAVQRILNGACETLGVFHSEDLSELVDGHVECCLTQIYGWR